MYQKNPKKKSYKIYVFASIVALILVPGILLILEGKGVTNFYSSDGKSTDVIQDDIRSLDSIPTNTVDYGPPRAEDGFVVPDKDPDSTPTTPGNSDLSATITSTRKNSAGTAYLIKVAVMGTDSGSCTATMTKGSKTITANSGISLSAGVYSCTNLEVPLSELSESGIWNIGVTVTDKTGATSATNTEVIL